jgi:hypothetical protein
VSQSLLPCRSAQNLSLYQDDAELYKQALWAIPDITESGTRNHFVITSTIVGLITLFVAFNLENIAGSTGKLYYCWRDMVVEDMQDNNRWKERGEELRHLGPTRRTPSEWWLLGYLMYKSLEKIKSLARVKRENKMKKSKLNGGAC